MHYGEGKLPMIEILKNLATSFEAVRDFRKDPQAYLDRYPDLTAQERDLLLEGDSGKVSGYVSGKVNATTTIVVIILPAPSLEMRDGAKDPARTSHSNFWDHVSQRSSELAA